MCRQASATLMLLLPYVVVKLLVQVVMMLVVPVRRVAF